jgi:D-glycero-D-manno-heptose 1,7-bisphosphate phosphatase
MSPRPAVFLDRDGVIVRDVDQVLNADALEIYDGVVAALAEARARGYAVVVITNQPVVARGLVTEEEIDAIHAVLQARLGGGIDAFYVCPHHPNATLERYRVACECRKPRPGLLLRAARELEIDLQRSVMIGDRASDVAAGARAGTQTVLLTTGMHTAPAIESPDGPLDVRPGRTCVDLGAALSWFFEQ